MPRPGSPDSPRGAGRFLALARRLALLAGTLALASCRHQEHYVLVHGAFMGAWAWDGVAADLRNRGDKVTVIDLPGHGDDQTPASDITLDAYLNRVDQAVDAEGVPVVLVGHSMAGMVITAYGERAPGKIKLMVYMAAYVIPDGKSMLDVGPLDTGSQAGPNLMVDPQTGSLSFPVDLLEPDFCADCTAAELQNFKDHYRNDYLAPLGVKLTVTEANWGSVPKAYLFTANDVAVTLGFQHQMADAMTLAGSATVNTSHCGQLSAPHEVAAALDRLTHP